MCGICGYTGEKIPHLLPAMCEAIRHRGPDSEGILERDAVHLGNRRLRILDLEGGDQPIYNEDRSVGIVYNGEIYNFAELRDELRERGHVFTTQTDTEVIVHLYEEEGTQCARRLNGMFAFALYDARRKRLFLARDPVGIKPLFYWWNGKNLVFGSEAKSILPHPRVTPELDPDALHLLLNIRFVPGPFSLFRGIRQLPPGHTLVLEGGRLREERFHGWDMSAREPNTLDEAAEAFMETFSGAVKRQMVADVPVGIYLSGGLDSSSVLAAASQTAADRGLLETFSLGFGEPTDEVDDARRVAQHFGTAHRDTKLSPHPLELYPRIVYHAEVPKVNAPQGYYLSRFVREAVTVALSGLGGDELFLGYDIYRYLWPGRLLIDSPAGRAARPFAGLVNRFAGWLDRVGGLDAENTRRGVELLACGKDPIRYWSTLRNGWDLRPGAAAKIYTPDWERRVGVSTRDAFAGYFDELNLPFVEQVQLAEFRAKMVDDFLWNEDRMSMANSLEVRVPFLDREVIRFALALPLSVKFARGNLKTVMKRALEGHLPPRTLAKKKWGFTFNPYHQFRKDLRDLCRRELTRDFISEQGIVRFDFIERILNHSPSPRLRWHYFMLWQLLGLKYWTEIFLEGRDWREIEERVAHGNLVEEVEP